MKRIAVVLLIAAAVLSGCSGGRSKVEGEKVREFANALYNRELYSQAIQEYTRYLDLYTPDDKEQANIQFVIGNIYFERLHDYENAMASYLKVKHLHPESDLMPQVDKQVVQCLERLRRSTDAKQALDEATSLEPSALPKSRPGEVVARIGDRTITSGDLQFQIGQLPDYVKSGFGDRKGKVEFLHQYVATELFFDAAKRKGLNQDKDVVEGTFQAQKSLMVQKYLEQEVADQVKITPEDVELYYKGNMERYAEKDKSGKVTRQKPLDEVRKQAAEDLLRERQQKALNELVERMMRTEKVELYDDRVQ